MRNGSLIPAVRSLRDLENRARTDARYQRLCCVASENLGGPGEARGWQKCYQYLVDSAMSLEVEYGSQTAEADTVNEINFVRDCL